MVSLNIYKNSANKFIRKTGFKIENEIEDQDQSIPKLIGILTQVFCTFCPNLVILAWTGDELSCREAQNGVTFDFEVKFDLEGQGQSPPKTIGILTKVFYTYGPNLVILAWTGDELSRGQASDYRTHGRTDERTHRQTQATTIPEGQNWPRVMSTTWYTQIKPVASQTVCLFCLPFSWLSFYWCRLLGCVTQQLDAQNRRLGLSVLINMIYHFLSIPTYKCTGYETRKLPLNPMP